MTESTLAVSLMRDLVRLRAATPLLPNTDVCPTWYADKWWYVPDDGSPDAVYQIADDDLAAEFEALRGRVDRITAAAEQNAVRRESDR
jgi:hypothetical protein